MNILFVLIILSLIMGLVGLLSFAWALFSNQYQNLDDASKHLDLKVGTHEDSI